MARIIWRLEGKGGVFAGYLVTTPGKRGFEAPRPILFASTWSKARRWNGAEIDATLKDMVKNFMLIRLDAKGYPVKDGDFGAGMYRSDGFFVWYTAAGLATVRAEGVVYVVKQAVKEIKRAMARCVQPRRARLAVA